MSLTIGQLESISALCLLFTETFSVSLVAFQFTKSEASCEPELQNHTSTSAFNFKVWLFSTNFFGKPARLACMCCAAAFHLPLEARLGWKRCWVKAVQWIKLWNREGSGRLGGRMVLGTAWGGGTEISLSKDTDILTNFSIRWRQLSISLLPA